MFNISTKAAVLASSNVKNIGPKYGSIGYAAVDDDIQYSPYLLNPGTTDGIMLARCVVMFTRYGFSKERPKHECKTVLNVFPIINRSVKVEDMKQIVLKTVSKFKKEDFENRFWLNTKMNFAGSTSTNVCIMAPVLTLGTDLRTCSNLEFSAWFSSMLSIYSMKTSIARINTKCFLNKLPSKEDREIAVSLRRCVAGNSNRLEYLNKIIGSPERRAPVAKLLKLIHSITRAQSEEYIRKQMRLRFKNGEYRYSKGKTDTNSNLFRTVVYDIFSDHAFEAMRRMAAKSTVNAIVSRIGHTKRILELMAHEIANKNGEWNHLHIERG